MADNYLEKKEAALRNGAPVYVRNTPSLDTLLRRMSESQSDPLYIVKQAQLEAMERSALAYTPQVEISIDESKSAMSISGNGAAGAAAVARLKAAELGLNPKLAKRAGLLHDIGKVSDTELEVPHAIYGAQLAEQYKERPEVVNAIGAHHDEIEMDNLISPIVQVCDAISGARPGARREVVEAYIQRLNKLEEMAMSYQGVVKTYAIQAGRELRVIVGADKVSDADADRIAYDLSKKIQTEMTYPGQIKITVIRETRAVSFAK